MASPLDRVVSFRTLEAATDWLLRDVGRDPHRCGQLTPVDAVLQHGALIGRTICYARRAPLWVVAHEVGHLICGHDAGHGPRWLRTYSILHARLANAPMVTRL